MVSCSQVVAGTDDVGSATVALPPDEDTLRLPVSARGHRGTVPLRCSLRPGGRWSLYCFQAHARSHPRQPVVSLKLNNQPENFCSKACKHCSNEKEAN